MWLFPSVSPPSKENALLFLFFLIRTRKTPVINTGEQNVRQAQAVAFLIGEGKDPGSWTS